MDVVALGSVDLNLLVEVWIRCLRVCGQGLFSLDCC